jgi:hypothetical protein
MVELKTNIPRTCPVSIILADRGSDHQPLLYLYIYSETSIYRSRVIHFPRSVIQFLWFPSESYFNYGSCIYCFPVSIVSFSDPLRERWIEVSLYMYEDCSNETHWMLFWVKDYRSLIMIPMDGEAGIPLTHQPMHPLHKEWICSPLVLSWGDWTHKWVSFERLTYRVTQICTYQHPIGFWLAS